MSKKFYKEQKNNAKYFIDAAQKIADWNAIAFNKSTSDFEDFSSAFTQDKFELQIALVCEELKEYRDAVKADNHIEMMDALADSFVVTSFLAYMFFGPDIQKTFLEYPVGDHFADDPYNGFMEARSVFTDGSQMAYFAAMLMRMARDSLNTCIYDGKAVLDEVLRSNSTKYPTAESLRKSHGFLKNQDMALVLQREFVWLEENRTQYNNFTSTFNEEYQVYVFKDGNGKIMKPSTFSPANVKSIVEVQ